MAVTRPQPPAPPRGPAIRRGLLSLAGAAFLGAGFVFGGISLVPGLRDDLAVREAARPSPGVQLRQGRCRSRLFLLQDCEVTIDWSGKDGSGTRQLHYLFVEPHMGDWQVLPLADPARLHLATTDLGLDRLTNRMLTLAGMAMAGLLLVGALLVGGLRALFGRG